MFTERKALGKELRQSRRKKQRNTGRLSPARGHVHGVRLFDGTCFEREIGSAPYLIFFDMFKDIQLGWILTDDKKVFMRFEPHVYSKAKTFLSKAHSQCL